MRLDEVTPDLRRAVRFVPAPPVDRPLVLRVVRAGVGRLPEVATPGVTVTRPVPGAPGVRLYRPGRRRPEHAGAALLWVHGGGYLFGAAVMDDATCGGTAAALGIPVVSVEYRLAPEHPFPVPLDDCRAGWSWLQEHAAELEVDPTRVVVGGESAGGGLAAALVQRLHDEGARPLAQLLFCPMLDDRTAARHELDAVRHRVWNNRINRFAWRSYLRATPGSASVPPYAVPARRDDLAGLPPAWLGVGDIDLFLDENRAYAERLGAAGVPATLHVVPGAPHGFQALARGAATTRGFFATAWAWLDDVLAV